MGFVVSKMKSSASMLATWLAKRPMSAFLPSWYSRSPMQPE
jgi:hypothetical protein